MKRLKLLGVFLTVALPVGSVDASWLDGRPYVGGGVSYTVYDGLDDVASDKDAVDYQSISKNAFGLMGFVGWTFPKGYSLELSYADFGEFEISEHTNVDSGDPTVNAVIYDDVSGSITGKAIGMRYDWSQHESMNAYARIGVMRWEAAWDISTRYEERDAATNELLYNSATNDESNTDGSDLYIGVGGQYEILHNLFAYAEGYYLDAKFDKDGFDVNERVFAVFGGVKYQFGDVTRPSGATDRRKRDVTACDPKYKDVSGLACE